MLNWNKKWIQEYESTWGIFEKFKYANNINGRDFFQFVTGNKKVNFTPKTVQHKSINHLKLIAKDRLSAILGINFDEYDEIKDVLKSPITTFTIFNNNLCFCKKCISQGYHSIFHQYQFISHCPFHPEERLTDKCPNCNKNFRGYDLGCDVVGFCCENCNANIITSNFFSLIKHEWLNPKNIKEPFVASLMSQGNLHNIDAAYIYNSKNIGLSVLNNEIFAKLNKEYLKVTINNRPLSKAIEKSGLYSMTYISSIGPKLKIGYAHRELIKDFDKSQLREPKSIVQISKLKHNDEIEFLNKLLDYELFKRSKAILKSVDRYILRKLNRKINLEKELNKSTKLDPHTEAYKNWKVSIYGIFGNHHKIYSVLGIDTPVFNFRSPFTFNQTQTYPFITNSDIIDSVVRELKKGDYSFRLIANVFCKLLFNFLYMHFQECLCYALNLKNVKLQTHILPPFIQIVKRENDIVKHISFLNAFELFNIDLSLVGEPNTKWTSEFD